MRIDQLSAADAVASLHSAPQGLTSGEALRRLREFGPNQVEKVAGQPLWLRFFKECFHFFAVILWVAAALAFVGEWSAPGQGMAKVGCVVIGVIVVSGLFSFWQEYRAEQTLAALLKLLPQEVKVLRDDNTTPLAVTQLVPGDIVLLEQGDNIPADCRLIEAFGVRVNNATITGESLPKARDAKPAEAAELIYSNNILLAGTAMASGAARAVVFATGMHTEFGKIAHLAQTSRGGVSPLRREIAHLSQWIAILAVVIGLLFFAIGWALGLGVEKPAPEVMRRPPRPQHERLLNWPLALRAYCFLGMIEATAAMAAFFYVLHGAGWQYGQTLAVSDPVYLQATTACLSAIIVMQIVNVFLCRSATRSVFSVGLFGNPLIVWGVILEIALILPIAYTPWGNLIFGTAPIAGHVWLFLIPFAVGLFFLEELRKGLVRGTWFNACLPRKE